MKATKKQELSSGFLGDIVGLDLSRYEVDLKWYTDYSSYTCRLFDADATYSLVSALALAAIIANLAINKKRKK